MKTIQKLEQYQKCRVCDYDKNKQDATHCEICNISLKHQPVKDVAVRVTNFGGRNPLAVLVLLIVLFLINGYIFWTLAKIDSSTSTNAEGKQLSTADSNFQPRYFSIKEVPDVPKGIFSYGGAICFAAMTRSMNSAIARSHPQFELRYTQPLNQPPGCSTGMQMLLDGELSFAQNGRPLLEDEYASAKQRNIYLVQVPVAIDGIAFFTHPTQKVSKLTVKQLQDIYTGKIKNWKQLGGQDLPIVPIGQDIKIHNTLKLLLGNQIENISNDVKIVRDYTSAMRMVASTTGGISYSSAAIAQNQKTIRSLALANSNSKNYISPFTNANTVNIAAIKDGTYPITRRLFVVIRRDGTLDQQAGEAYARMLLTTEGQRIIEDSGFAAIYSK